jgi:hypothetical protein
MDAADLSGDVRCSYEVGVAKSGGGREGQRMKL